MAFRESAQAQARHTIQVTKSKAGGLAKSLRDQKHRVHVMGVLGVMHQQFGGSGGPSKIVHSMFEKVDGLGGEAKEAEKLAEVIYVAAITGDDPGLEKALEQLQAARDAAEKLKADAGEGGEGGGADPPEFDPKIGLDGAPAPAAAPAWCIRDARGIEPLALAAARGHSGALKLLLDASASVDAQAKTCGRTALHRAAETGKLDCLTLLVEFGADVLSVQHNGQCALCSASAGGYADCIAVLLEHGAAVDQRDLLGMTPLMAASEGGHVDATTSLIAAGAVLDAADGVGYQALHHAARGGHEEVALSLYRAGAPACDTRGGNTLRDLNGSIASQIDELVQQGQAGDGDEDDDDEGDAARPVTAP